MKWFISILCVLVPTYAWAWSEHDLKPGLQTRIVVECLTADQSRSVAASMYHVLRTAGHARLREGLRALNATILRLGCTPGQMVDVVHVWSACEEKNQSSFRFRSEVVFRTCWSVLTTKHGDVPIVRHVVVAEVDLYWLYKFFDQEVQPKPIEKEA